MNKEVNFETTECVEEVTEVCELSENLGGNKIVKGLAVGLGVTAVAGFIIAMVRKHKGLLDKLAIKRLSKKGYTVMEPIDDIPEIEETTSEVKDED